MRRTRRIGKLLLTVMLICLLAGAVVMSIVMAAVIQNAPDVSKIDIRPKEYATYLYDTNGEVIQKLGSAEANRTAVSIEQIPEVMQHAIVAIEDERFYQHNGIDVKGIFRAAWKGISHGFHFSQGASTITQQLIKNNVFTSWTSERSLEERIERKIQEQYLAVKLEALLQDKSVILEAYLNTINFGAGTYGVEAASQKYFGKEARELTASEAAVLAAIPQNPSKYNPIRHPEWNETRRALVLQKMLEQGYLTEAEKTEALQDPVYERIQRVQDEAVYKEAVYSSFTDAVIRRIIKDLKEQKGYTEEEAYQLLYSGGLKIYTTQNANVQEICDDVTRNPENYPETVQYSLNWKLHIKGIEDSTTSFTEKDLHDGEQRLYQDEAEAMRTIAEWKEENGIEEDEIESETFDLSPEPQVSVVIMDHETGRVTALVGGRGEKTASLTLNRAVDSLRQPASTFKILAVYVPALESGEYQLDSKVLDRPYAYDTGAPVHNAEDTYRGIITIKEAIAHSVNVVAVKILTRITPEVGYRAAERFGITTLDQNHDQKQVLALGGLYRGVSNLELTAAYAAIANKGIYTEPVFYTQVLDQEGNIILENASSTRYACSERTALAMTEAMEEVVERGTGTEAKLTNGKKAVGKTGTTSDYRDLWFVGSMENYTMGVWSGNDDNSVIDGLEGEHDYQKVIWRKIMEGICNLS
ncbi:MAG: PBP1A family penicillin-binding protein [Eubacteriales bacterium]|nr:PBP1A family penicillin-binding protein [Eubacteriales bacterium]